MIEEWREFTGEDRQRAVASAVSHFSVSEEQLDVRLIPQGMGVAGLGARVLILASIRPAPEPVEELSDVGEFISAVVQKLGAGERLKVRESDEDGAITVRVSAPGLDELIRRDAAVPASLSHLAERAAQKFLGDAMEARVEIVREQRDSRGGGGGGRGRDGRGGGRGDRGDRGDGRGRSRDGREGREGREGGRDGRGRRGGRGGDRGEQRGGDRGDRDRGTRERGGRGDGDIPRDPELEQKARDTAERVRDTGQEVTLPAMGSRERWIVHNAIRDIEGVTSTSVGEGDQKRVKILPE
jgi:predicted RNA-binding protein Jag